MQQSLVLFFFFCVTTEPCYACFHDEEWGVPVHDDKYTTMTFFLSFLERLELSGAHFVN